jgi:hypothetical protein
MINIILDYGMEDRAVLIEFVFLSILPHGDINWQK